MDKLILPNFDLKKKKRQDQKFSLTFLWYPLCLLMREEPMKIRLQWKTEKNSEERICNEEMKNKVTHIYWASFCAMVDSLPSLL